MDPAASPVLFVRLGAIGDVVRTLPALAWLRRERPGSPVDWLVEGKSAPILQGHQDLRRVIVFPRREIARNAARLSLVAAGRALRSALREINGSPYGAVVDFQGTLKSGLLAWATGCPRRIGLAAGHAREGSARFYTQRVDPGPEPISRVQRSFLLLQALGVEIPGAGEVPRGQVPVGEIDRAWAAGVLASLAPPGRSRVLLYPGASRAQEYKRWPPERFGFLAGRLRDDGCQVLVAAGPGEEAVVEEVCEATSTPPAKVPPSSLKQLAALLEGVDLFVGGDTGPMHLAAAMGTPVLAIFGATDPRVNAPWGGAAAGHRVLYRGPAERPYRVTGGRARHWMEAVGLDEVHACCRKMLGLRRR